MRGYETEPTGETDQGGDYGCSPDGESHDHWTKDWWQDDTGERPWHDEPRDWGWEAMAEKFKAWFDSHGVGHERDGDDHPWHHHGGDGMDWASHEPGDKPDGGWNHDHTGPQAEKSVADEVEEAEENEAEQAYSEPGEHGCVAGSFDVDTDRFEWAEKSQDIKDKLEALAESFDMRDHGPFGGDDAFEDIAQKIQDGLEAHGFDGVEDDVAAALQNIPDLSSLVHHDMFSF